ncbi:MAG: amino acid permease [Propionibacteriaceae bacterium]|nr:amino acid permease [Propionibacteriaceae bacterium]
MSAASTGLKASMRPRHLVMMSLGSAIGAGLFVGSGRGIATAGPSVLLAYLIAGTVILMVMRMLAEMVAADPNPGAFSYYVGKALGQPAAFALGWLWWVQYGLVVAAEATAAAEYLNGIFPAVQPWLFALIAMVAFTTSNLAHVGSFGELEFWFALIKVGFVVGFLILGVAFLLGFTSGTSPGLYNLTSASFLPQGLGGLAGALLVVIFAFGGIELMAVAAAETAEPQRAVAKAVRTILWRILLFYMGAVTIMLLALPWDDPEIKKAPFVAVLNTAGFPALAAAIAVIIIIALLSALNANLYGASRMVYSLAERGLAPAALSRTNGRGVPVNSVLATSAFGFAAVALNYFYGEVVLDTLLNIVGSTLIVTWIMTILAHLVLRRRAERDGIALPLKMWAFPYLSWATLTALLGIVVLGFTVPEVAFQLITTFLLTLVLFGIGWMLKRRGTRDAAS